MTKTESSPSDLVDKVIVGFAAEMPQIDSVILEAVCRLIVAGKGMEQAAAAMLKQFGFNYSDFDVLGMLRSAGPPYELSPAELLKFTLITSGAMTTCLDRLENAGMVTRRMSEKDRRARVISLTEKGKEAIEEALSLRMNKAASSLSALKGDELKTLINLLKKIENQGTAKASPSERLHE